MHVTVVKLSLSLENTHSLKSKRNIIRPVIEKVKARFNVSISEVSMQDNLHTGALGISCASNSVQNNLKVVNKLLDFIESSASGFVVTDTQTETITGF
jgi:hypothetical protein|tara:strand:- start:629 stop:922 length:294 start_codon:yes stop_codon:yes gene_type:complete